MNAGQFYILIILALSVGGLYAYFFYRHSPEFGKRLRVILSGLRGFFVFLLVYLVFSAGLEWTSVRKENPFVLFLQDNSQSIALRPSPGSPPAEYAVKVKSLIARLSQKYQVEPYSFGQDFTRGLPLTYRDKATNVSALLSEIKAQYQGRNVGAIMLASDGEFNEGQEPLKALKALHIPLITIGLGDTSVPKDVIIHGVEQNEVAFSGDLVPVRASVRAQNMRGVTVTAVLRQGNKILQKKVFTPKRLDEQLFIPFTVTAPSPGAYWYSIELQTNVEEVTKKNNKIVFSIISLAGRQKIVLASSLIHPDLTALAQALRSNKNYRVEFYTIGTKPFPDLSSVSCLINYQSDPTWLTEMNQSPKILDRLPVLYCFGEQFGPSSHQRGGRGLDGPESANSDGRSPVRINPYFTLFSPGDSVTKLLPLLPPLLHSTVITQRFDPTHVLLMEGRAGYNAEPILWFKEINQLKSGYWCAEGIWRWRAYEYALTGGHSLIDGLIKKTISFLTVHKNPSGLSVDLPKTVWNENEPIYLLAECYDQAGKASMKSPMTVEITDEQGRRQSRKAVAEDRQYRATIGRMPLGTYQYKVIRHLAGRREVQSGVFMVAESNLEFQTSQANHSLLVRMAVETGGRFLHPSELEQIPGLLAHDQRVRPVLHTRLERHSWVDQPWILGLLIILVTTEWGLRKWSGVY